MDEKREKLRECLAGALTLLVDYSDIFSFEELSNFKSFDELFDIINNKHKELSSNNDIRKDAKLELKQIRKEVYSQLDKDTFDGRIILYLDEWNYIDNELLNYQILKKEQERVVNE